MMSKQKREQPYGVDTRIPGFASKNTRPVYGDISTSHNRRG